ncbi:MAG: squalene synthase HpnC [Rhodoferax sp.]|nr:squalene synthase HpnC [Rhodoferax sp.]
MPSAAPIQHYENFPVASWLCPQHLRAPIAAIYHFARTADDIADEGDATAAERLAALQAYRADLDAAAGASPNSTSASWPHVFGPLQLALRQHQLPLPLLHDLLDAFVQDVEKTRDQTGYADDAALRDYCRRSANPVGRLLLHLYGVADAVALRRSDAICTALQLINFWQDLSVDIPRGRHYLSAAACAQFGVTAQQLQALEQTKNATQLIAAYADAARATMLNGSPLVHQLPGRAGWELRLVVQGGLRILHKMQAQGYTTLQRRPKLGGADYLVMLWRALWM